MIGDLRTGALIGSDGSVDWLSLPRFDSAAVHAALLGTDQHGHWSLAPSGDEHHTQRRYRPGTLILETEWITPRGAVRVTDFMDPTSAAPQVLRIVDGLLGTVQMHTSFSPRTGYGHDRPMLGRGGSRLVASSAADVFWLDSDAPLRFVDDAWTGSFTVAAGDRVTFPLSHTTTSPDMHPALSGPDRGSPPDPTRQLSATDAYWTGWSSRSTYHGSWETQVTQSLVLLKALTYAPTGSILAAATTSLPELIGGTRNWDYRYSWLRDATFSIQAFLAAGYLDEAIAWRSWLIDTIADDPTSLQVMYGIDGARHLPERTLDWLPGFSGSAPVRIGNAAADQQQNDIYGEVLDTLTAIQNAGAAPAPQLEPGLLEDNHQGLRAAYNAVTKREFRKRLTSARKRFASRSRIDIRGCTVGGDPGFLTSFSRLFQGDAGAPTISAPTLFMAFFRPGNQRLRTTEQVANAAAIKDVDRQTKHWLEVIDFAQVGLDPTQRLLSYLDSFVLPVCTELVVDQVGCDLYFFAPDLTGNTSWLAPHGASGFLAITDWLQSQWAPSPVAQRQLDIQRAGKDIRRKWMAGTPPMCSVMVDPGDPGVTVPDPRFAAFLGTSQA